MIGKYYRLFKVMLEVSLARLTIFRADFLFFFAWLSVEIIIDVAFFWVIYGSSKGIPGWTLHELIFFVLVSGLFYDIFFSLCGDGPLEFVNNFTKGELDFTLIKPVNALFYLTFKEINLRNFSFTRLVGLIILWPQMHFTFGVGELFIAALSMALAVFAMHSLFVVIMASVFYTMEGNAAMEAYWRLTDAINYPKEIYPNIVGKIFTFVVPVILAGYIPAKTLLGQGSITLLLSAGVGVVVSYIVSRACWGVALKSYSSASS